MVHGSERAVELFEAEFVRCCKKQEFAVCADIAEEAGLLYEAECLRWLAEINAKCYYKGSGWFLWNFSFKPSHLHVLVSVAYPSILKMYKLVLARWRSARENGWSLDWFDQPGYEAEVTQVLRWLTNDPTRDARQSRSLRSPGSR